MPKWIDVPGDNERWQLVEGSFLSQLIEDQNAVAAGITGTGSSTLAAATANGAGTTTIVGTSARTLAADTATAAGTTTIVGTATSTVAADTAIATGTTTIVGAADAQTGNDIGTGTGNAGTPTPTADDVHSLGGGPRPRRRQQLPPPPRSPLALPSISGWTDVTIQHATCAATGDVDPFNLLAEDEELLLLV